MSYRRSRARRAFEAQLAQAERELAVLYRHAVAAGGGAGSRLLAAYYVFAFAQLEVYIKSFVEDSLSALATAPPAFDRWPDLLMGYLLHKSEDLGADYRRFAISEDEGALLEKVAAIARKVSVWSATGAAPQQPDPKQFLDKKKYPSPKNLPQLFKRLGVKQIWAVVSAAGKFNSQLILTSLNDLRTDIAHEGQVPPGFSIGDYRNRLEQMRRFVAALDRGVSAHFCRGVFSRSAWNGAMA